MKIGLLPLYIKLYDETSPEVRPRMDAFYERVAGEFEKRNVAVVKSSFCRIKKEFEAAVDMFETEKVDAIVTLHIAYSPSLESIDVLAGTKLPLIVLDTTETLEFGPMQNPGEVMFNHGIHGVMDLCSMLRRRGKEFAIAAGHYLESDCIDRVCGYVKASSAACAIKASKVCLVGGTFEGMGDFAVEPEELKARFGIITETVDSAKLSKISAEVTQTEIDAEIAEHKKKYDFAPGMVEEEYEDSVRSCLALRKYIKESNCTAFSVNFLCVGEGKGLASMPFLECCKAMERGIGYAGEGDGLTAAFMGALLSAYPETNFVEIFCPDWKNNLLYLSHMGEMNYGIADCRPLICRAETNFTPGNTPYMGYTWMKAGKGVYVNICRDQDDYRLFVAEAEMIDCQEDNFPHNMRGWMKPENLTTAQFLEEHSRCGATHHSIFVYGAKGEELAHFGKLLNMQTKIV